jgi:formyltetrahydrofolate deformylase
MKKIILLMHCPDQKGIIADVTNFIHNRKGNIVYIDQYVDRPKKAFYMRVEIETNESKKSFKEFKIDFEKKLIDKFHIKCNFYLSKNKPKMAIFVSKYDHCLYDILAQHQSGKLNCEIPFIMSNHNDLRTIADRFEIPYYHIPVNKSNKIQAEKNQLEILKKHKIDLIVLARYMQIVSPQLINVFRDNIINIHHSFLPAFPGAKPYHSAFERGVKIIGATSHYVTEELDAGPIIEQDIARVSHIHKIDDFISMGRDLERMVLLRALKLHNQRKVMIFDNKTIVFN